MTYIMDQVHVDLSIPKIDVNLQAKPEINVNFGTIIIRDSHEHYHGAYEITPKAFEDQILETDNKVLDDDILVREIPYYETSNPNGFTAIIG